MAKPIRLLPSTMGQRDWPIGEMGGDSGRGEGSERKWIVAGSIYAQVLRPLWSPGLQVLAIKGAQARLEGPAPWQLPTQAGLWDTVGRCSNSPSSLSPCSTWASPVIALPPSPQEDQGSCAYFTVTPPLSHTSKGLQKLSSTSESLGCATCIVCGVQGWQFRRMSLRSRSWFPEEDEKDITVESVSLLR